MPKVQFTAHLQRFLDCPPADVAGKTVRAVLGAVFSDNPRLRGYILDDQGRLRKHVMVFVDSEPIEDREQLSDAVQESSEVFVMQALSGGCERAVSGQLQEKSYASAECRPLMADSFLSACAHPFNWERKRTYEQAHPRFNAQGIVSSGSKGNFG